MVAVGRETLLLAGFRMRSPGPPFYTPSGGPLGGGDGMAPVEVRGLGHNSKAQTRHNLAIPEAEAVEPRLLLFAGKALSLINAN
jgi:hypothetical protein